MKSTVHKRIIYVIIVSFFLPLFMSCSLVEYHDISADAKYAGMTGRVYKTNVILGVYGVEQLWTRTEEIHSYFITDSLDIRAPEIIPIGCLPQGSLLKITRIVQSSEPSFLAGKGGNIDLIVEILNNSSLKGVTEVHVDHTYGRMYTERGNSLELNSEVFTEIVGANNNQ